MRLLAGAQGASLVVAHDPRAAMDSSLAGSALHLVSRRYASSSIVESFSSPPLFPTTSSGNLDLDALVRDWMRTRLAVAVDLAEGSVAQRSLTLQVLASAVPERIATPFGDTIRAFQLDKLLTTLLAHKAEFGLGGGSSGGASSPTLLASLHRLERMLQKAGNGNAVVLQSLRGLARLPVFPSHAPHR